jgi:hypothetical protein
LVAQGYTQVKGIDFDEKFAPIARLKSVRLLLVIAYAKSFTLQQIDVKGTFFNSFYKKKHMSNNQRALSIQSFLIMSTD